MVYKVIIPFFIFKYLFYETSKKAKLDEASLAYFLIHTSVLDYCKHLIDMIHDWKPFRFRCD